MLAQCKKRLFSENGMKIVNTLFLLSVFLPNPALKLCADVVWLAFLIYSIRTTRSKGLQVWYAVLCVLAGLLAGGSLYSLTFL